MCLFLPIFLVIIKYFSFSAKTLFEQFSIFFTSMFFQKIQVQLFALYFYNSTPKWNVISLSACLIDLILKEINCPLHECLGIIKEKTENTPTVNIVCVLYCIICFFLPTFFTFLHLNKCFKLKIDNRIFPLFYLQLWFSHQEKIKCFF